MKSTGLKRCGGCGVAAVDDAHHHVKVQMHVDAQFDGSGFGLAPGSAGRLQLRLLFAITFLLD